MATGDRLATMRTPWPSSPGGEGAPIAEPAPNDRKVLPSITSTALEDLTCPPLGSNSRVWRFGPTTPKQFGAKGGVPFCRRFLDLCSDHRLIERRPIDIISRGTSCGEANIKPVPGRSNASL